MQAAAPSTPSDGIGPTRRLGMLSLSRDLRTTYYSSRSASLRLVFPAHRQMTCAVAPSTGLLCKGWAGCSAGLRSTFPLLSSLKDHLIFFQNPCSRHTLLRSPPYCIGSLSPFLFKIFHLSGVFYESLTSITMILFNPFVVETFPAMLAARSLVYCPLPPTPSFLLCPPGDPRIHGHH